MNKFLERRSFYCVLFLLFFFLEVGIARYVKDGLIRPYIGDLLVVIVVYCLIRIFVPTGMKFLPFYVFVFSFVVEILQLFDLVNKLGLQNNAVLRIAIGSVFDLKDILCYAVGCLFLVLYERIFDYSAKKDSSI